MLDQFPTHGLSAEMAKFLHVELALGLTFAGIALKATHDLQKRERNRLNAHKAFDAVVNFRKRTEMPGNDYAEFSANLERLKAALDRLDATV